MNIMTIHREPAPAGEYRYYRCNLQGLRKLEERGVSQVWYYGGMVYIPEAEVQKSLNP